MSRSTYQSCQSPLSPHAEGILPVTALVPRFPGRLVFIDFSRHICHNYRCFCAPRPNRIYIYFAPAHMPRTAENVIRESNMPLTMAYDYLAAARLYAAYVVIQSERFRQTGVAENSLLSPDELLRIIYPDVPPGIFDFMDSRITMSEDVEWPDLEAIYGNQW